MFSFIASAARARMQQWWCVVCMTTPLPLATTAAQSDSSAARRDTAALSAVTIIGTQTDIAQEHDRMLRTPGGVSLISVAELHATRQANLHDVLRFTPGVFVQPRSGAADESQISIRGSGLRNNFHARGVNLLVNGMPYRNADGFTDFESIELLTAETIDVYKGANALRYGGSTLGGAINVQTKTGYTATPFTAVLEGGSLGFAKAQLASGGMRGHLDWYASAAHTQTGGYRAWADQRRDRVNLHVGYRLGQQADVRFFYFGAHVQEHLPGSVTLATLDTAPTAADPTNVSNKWGRDYQLHHLGAQYRVQLSNTQRLEISPYLQYRDIDHPIFEVIAQISQDWGAEVRYETTAPVAGLGNRLSIGVQPALGNVQNKQFQNSAGRHGPLTRDELDRAATLALYAEDALSLSKRVVATAGLRAEHDARRAEDRFLSNGNQSDTRGYHGVSPRMGLMIDLTRTTRVFANASHTMEPPLLLELTSFGNPGGFIPLRAQNAWQYEIGTRTRQLGVSWEMSLYDIELRDELLNENVQPFASAPFTVPTYRNVPSSRHTGLEAAASVQEWMRLFARGDVRDMIGARVSYTYSRFRFVDDSAFAGNDLPGAPRHYVVGELTYEHPSGFRLTPSMEAVPRAYAVNSANTARNSAWAAFGLRADWSIYTLGSTVFASVQNLTNARYSASVQVDNATGRFFEPADPRSFYVGMRVER
jgi:iron complex outermembrane receptor protein